MVPPTHNDRRAKDKVSLTWDVIGKASISIVIAWAAYEFRELRNVVYSSQMRSAVIENRVSNVENAIGEVKTHIEGIEARLRSDKK